MAKTNDIDQVRERIRRQRERLMHTEPVAASVAEPVPHGAKPLATPHRGTRSSTLGSLGRLAAKHPVLAVGVGAAALLAGPRRSLRLARRAVRGAVFAMAAYRGASTVLGLLASSRQPSRRQPDRHDAPEVMRRPPSR